MEALREVKRQNPTVEFPLTLPAFNNPIVGLGFSLMEEKKREKRYH